jgi:CHAT domain-containing protein
MPKILHIDLRTTNSSADSAHVTLRYGWENPNAFTPRTLPLASIQDLLTKMEVDYYVPLPEDLVLTGQRLYQWLDGSDRTLTQLLQETTELVVLAIATAADLSHLPWELLHDGNRFLVARTPAAVVPVRWEGAALKFEFAPPPNRPLQTLFMATSPAGVEPVLAFEEEEGRILTATQRQPLSLMVEESGCLSELANLVASYAQGYFDVVHFTGHAHLCAEGPRFSFAFRRWCFCRVAIRGSGAMLVRCLR